MNARTAGLALALAAGAHAAAAPPPQLTLDRALELARTGPAGAAARAAVERAAAVRGEVEAVRRPRVEVTLADRLLAADPGFRIPAGALGNPVSLGFVAGERHVWSASILVRQLLWDAGRTRAALRAADLAREAAVAEREATRRAVDLAVLGAYRAARVTADLAAVAEEAVRDYAALVDQVRALVAAEQLPLADELQARAALEGARLELADARAAHRHALAALEELVGAEVAAVAPLPESPLPVTDGSWIDRALARREELTALARRAEALEARARAEEAAARPLLVASAEGSRVDDGYLLHRDNAAVGLALRVPVLDGGLARSRAAVALAEARAVRAELEAARRRVRREVRDALAALEAARQRRVAARAARDAAEEALRQARLRYREELITNRELLDAEAEAVRARRAEAVARTDLTAARLALQVVAGEDLLARLAPTIDTTEDRSHE